MKHVYKDNGKLQVLTTPTNLGTYNFAPCHRILVTLLGHSRFGDVNGAAGWTLRAPSPH
jgi:hypothetical protein